MVDQAKISSKVQFGFGKSASKVGVMCAHYRPQGAGSPMAFPISPLMAEFDIDPKFPFIQPSKYGNPVFYGLFDTSQTLPYDYIVHPDKGTFFVGSQEVFKPALCVSCNRVLTVERPGAGPSGPGYYGGDQTATEFPDITGWPASVLNGTKGEASQVGLPGDVRNPWVIILLPWPGVQLRAGDVVTDEQGITQRYILSSCELTNLGYRLTATIEVT